MTPQISHALIAERVFLEPIELLEQSGHIDAALDLLYDRFDDLLKDQQFNVIDHLLNSIDTSALSLDLLLGTLTATLPAKSKLRSRRDYFSRVEATLRARKQLEDGILIGLES